MAKKKKKTKLTEHELWKINEAQKRKAYLNRLFNMLDYLAYGGVAELMNNDVLNELWLTRMALARIEFSQVTHFGKEDRHYIQRELYTLFNMRKVPFPDETGAGREIFVSDFYEVWLPMMLSFKNEGVTQSLTKQKMKIRGVLKEYGIPFFEDNKAADAFIESVFSKMELHYRGFLLTFSFQFNNPCMHFFWVREMDYNSRTGRLGRDVLFTSQDPISVVGPGIKGSRRLLFRVGYPFLGSQHGGLRLLSAKIPRNPYMHFNPDEEYEVYIQEHAIKRMFERLDGVFPATVNIHMNHCFWQWQADWYKGSLLIPFELHYQRVGYFLADFTEDKKIIIRTFYFITYDRTPEGVAISSCAGLQAVDKKYLGIDKLSTFLASNFENNSKFAQILRQAGCGHLLALKKVLEYSIDTESGELRSISNDFIAKYLSTLEDE